MPANRRIVEKYIGIDDDGLEIWNRIELKDCHRDDRIRIYEDKESKDNKIKAFDGFVRSEPWYDEENNIATADLESIDDYNTRIDKEKLEKAARLTSIDPYDKNLSDDDYQLLLEKSKEDLEFFKSLLRVKDEESSNTIDTTLKEEI